MKKMQKIFFKKAKKNTSSQCHFFLVGTSGENCAYVENDLVWVSIKSNFCFFLQVECLGSSCLKAHRIRYFGPMYLKLGYLMDKQQ